MTLASTFSRPRWAMPSTSSLRRPSWLPRLMNLLQQRDQRFAAFQAEALGAGVLAVEELLEGLSRDQPLQDRLLAVVREFGVVADRSSTRSWIQAFWAGSWMCMNSTPILPQ